MNERRTLHFPIYLSTGVQMWRQNPSENVVTTLNHYGLYRGKKATRGYVDGLGANHDRRLLEWKTSNEVSVYSIHFNSIDMKLCVSVAPLSINIYAWYTKHISLYMCRNQLRVSVVQPMRLRNISYIWNISCDIFQRSHISFSILEKRHIYIYIFKWHIGTQAAHQCIENECEFSNINHPKQKFRCLRHCGSTKRT